MKVAGEGEGGDECSARCNHLSDAVRFGRINDMLSLEKYLQYKPRHGFDGKLIRSQ